MLRVAGFLGLVLILCGGCVLEDPYYIVGASRDDSSSEPTEPRPPTSPDSSGIHPGPEPDPTGPIVQPTGLQPSAPPSGSSEGSTEPPDASAPSEPPTGPGTTDPFDPVPDAGSDELSDRTDTDGDIGSSELTPAMECGDDVAEGDEACDGDDLRSQACTDSGFAGGRLKCSPSCALDTSECTTGVACRAAAENRTGVVFTGDTRDYTNFRGRGSYPCSLGGAGPDISISWTAPFTSCFQVMTTSERDLDTILAVYPTCNSQMAIACDDNSGEDELSLLEFDAVVGTTYAFAVDSYFVTDQGPISLHVSPCAPSEWLCPKEYYARGDGCDCGCGAFDPDCGRDANASACDFCNAPGSCATLSCDTVRANENWRCE